MRTTEALLWQQSAVRIEVIVASLVVAATMVLLFLVARERGLGRAWSVVIALVFAFVWARHASPVSIDERPERAWEWRDMQILRGLVARQDGF